MINKEIGIKGRLIINVIKEGAAYFSNLGIENSRLEAELLIAKGLKSSRLDLYLNFDKSIDPDKITELNRLLLRRGMGEPRQYIVGSQEFFGREFIVRRGTFIPRPETEILVEEAINLSKYKKVNRILDLCTGSGCIAITLGILLPETKIFATDSFSDPLNTARENARRYSCEERVTFLEGDLFDPLSESEFHFDLIISNPPYIPYGEIRSLQREVRDYEPIQALNGDDDGLSFYRRIISGAPSFLSENGSLLLEIGAGQKEGVVDLLKSFFPDREVRVIKDYAGIERVVGVIK